MNKISTKGYFVARIKNEIASTGRKQRGQKMDNLEPIEIYVEGMSSCKDA